ncbi:MAG: hypothetical protein J6Z40_07055 [Oscillospiraceae bacterium]|nr:hypothetical protein [Oscillospiraceae bacterium]
MDHESRKRAAELDADAALDAILKEIDSADRRKPSAADEIAAEVPRRRERTDSSQRSTERRRPESSERSRSQQSRPVSHAKESAPEESTAERPQRPAQRHRLPAAAERPEERSQRLAAERTRNPERSGERPARRPAERPERTERAADRPERAARPQRPAGERTERPERPQRNAERADRPQRTAERPAQRPQRTAPAAETVEKPKRTQQHRSSESGKDARKPSAFRIGMALYICVFLLATLFGMDKLWHFLKETEDALPEHTIDQYVENLGNTGFYTDMIRQHVDKIETSAYETPDTIAETLDVDSVSGGEYKWVKDVQNFTDKNPAYIIRCGNAAIATVQLEQVGSTPQFHKPVWKVCTPQSLIEIATEPQFSVDVTVPEGASVMVNGVAVPVEEFKEDESDVQLDEAAQMYAQQPKAQHVEIQGLFVAPKVLAYDSLGNPLTPSKLPNETDANQIYCFGPKPESSPDEELVDRVEDMMRAYIDYMANKDEALWTNLGILDTFLVPNSSAYKKLHSITQDINWNNPYTARQDRALDVNEVRMYADNVCTCDVHYDYQLTKNVVNDYIGDMRWTFVKTGTGWNATEFEITGSNDTKFGDDEETEAPAEG